MDSEFIQRCSLSPKNHHQFIVELDSLTRALDILEDFIILEQQTEQDQEYSLYQKVFPYFEKCVTRFRDLRLEENSYEFGAELTRDVSHAFEHITEMLILIEEKISSGSGDSNSQRSTRFMNFEGINNPNSNNQDSTDGNSTSNSWTETILEGITMGKKMQTRFDFIRKGGLSKETVAGFRDMNLGKIKGGKHVGKNVFRFDLGRKSGQPHINLDPRGFPSKKNPHIEVPASVVTAAPYVQKGVEYLGSALTVAMIVYESYRMYRAGREDYDKMSQDVVDIERLKREIVLIWEYLQMKGLLEDCPKKDLPMKDSPIIKSLKDAIKEYELTIQVIKNGQNVPVKSIKTGSTIAGGLAGGTVFGSLGATYGAAVSGAAAGLIFGPAGVMVCAIGGAISGAIGAGIGGGMAGSAAGELVAEKTLETVLGPITVDTQSGEDEKK